MWERCLPVKMAAVASPAAPPWQPEQLAGMVPPQSGVCAWTPLPSLWQEAEQVPW